MADQAGFTLFFTSKKVYKMEIDEKRNFFHHASTGCSRKKGQPFLVE